MEFKILTNNVTESEVNWFQFWARVTQAKSLEEIMPELTALAELGTERAIIAWYHFFPAGKNEIIDNLVKDYPDMTTRDALCNILDGAFNSKLAKTETEKQEWDKIIENSGLAMIKSCQTSEPKFTTLKELQADLLTYLGFFINPEEVQSQLDSYISNGSAEIEDLVECIGKLIKKKVKLKPEYKKLLKQLAKQPYCKQVQDKLDGIKTTVV